MQACRCAYSESKPKDEINSKLLIEELMNLTGYGVYKFKLKKVGELLDEERRRVVIRELGNGLKHTTQYQRQYTASSEISVASRMQ